MITADEVDFLRESNNIEDEWDDKALQDAILAWQYCKKQRNMSRGTVLIVHRMLMKSRDTLREDQKGAFRNGPVWIGGHEAKPYFAIEEMLDQWVDKMNILGDRYESISIEKEYYTRDCHVDYEAIHPFFDGNGRTGRIFYNWQRVKLGLPIHVIHTGKEQYEYYEWFGKRK